MTIQNNDEILREVHKKHNAFCKYSEYEILCEVYKAWKEVTVLNPTWEEFMRIVNTCILEVRAKLIAGQKSSHCSTGSIYVIGHMVDYDDKKPFRYEVMVTACHNIEGE